MSILSASLAACSGSGKSGETQAPAGETDPQTQAAQESGAAETAAPEETSENAGDTESSGSSDSGAASADVYSDMPVKEAKSDDPKDVLEAEIYNYKLIRNVPTAYEQESWEEYCSKANILSSLDAQNLGSVQTELIWQTAQAREDLVQIKSAEDCMWYIWGDSIPMAGEPDRIEFTAESYDNSDFKPFIVPYILDDQSNVKGNLILVSGGGYSERNNTGEGYPSAALFNELGYNCYVLQRRVAPYCADDIWMDMQRSIRYVRNAVEEMELGGADNICAAGFSGGSGTVLGAVALYYGDILPTVTDPDYVPDEIDKISSDLDFALCIYGPDYLGGTSHDDGSEFKGLVTDNPNIPDMFIAGGENDDLTYDANMVLANSVKDKVISELHVYAQVGHGFGAGREGTSSKDWIKEADVFMDYVKAIEAGTDGAAQQEAEIPEEYTKVQQYVVSGGFGDNTTITYAATDDESQFYIYFTSHDELQVLEGYIEDDGTVIVTYDKSGFMKGDAQMIVDSADRDGWEPIDKAAD